jgi:hypothetical protein
VLRGLVGRDAGNSTHALARMSFSR